MEKITNPNDIKNGMTLLLVDEENKIRGIDTIVQINKCQHTGLRSYDYIPYKTNDPLNNPYNMEYERAFKRYSIFSVDKSFAEKYSDEQLQNAWLAFDLGEVFYYALYNEPEGKVISQFIGYGVRKNIKNRIKFIDIANTYQPTLDLLRYTDTQNLADLKEVSKLKNELTDLMNSMK